MNPLWVLPILAWASVTSFVREAWAVQSVHVLLFAFALLRLRHLARWEALAFFPLPALGLLQLALGSSVYPWMTEQSLLHWTALACVFLIVRSLCTQQDARQRFLLSFLGFAIALAALCLLQLYTSSGKVLWLFDSGYDDFVYASFGYYNHFAQVIELALPIALWRTLEDEKRSLLFALAAGLMFAAVVASASRSGTVLCSIELLAFAILAFTRYRQRARTALIGISAVAAAAVIFTASAGWEQVMTRFQLGDPYVLRREFALSSLAMIQARPILGSGLGTWTQVYPEHALVESNRFVNRAHNDWLEYAAEGGILFSLLLAAPFLLSLRRMSRYPWALGILIVLLHAAGDYPFPRIGVAGWLFALTALIPWQSRRQPITMPRKGAIA
jgi:O-antigen ligase